MCLAKEARRLGPGRARGALTALQMLPRFAQSLCVTREANRDLRHKTDQRNCAGRHPGMDRRSQTQWPRLLRQVHHHAGRKYGDHYQLFHPSLKQWLGRRIEQQDQSAQAPLLRDRQSDQSLPPHLVGSKRLRSFCTLMAQDIGGLHGNSQRTNIRSVPLPILVTGIFKWVGGPIEMDALAEALMLLLDVKEQPVESIEQSYETQISPKLVMR